MEAHRVAKRLKVAFYLDKRLTESGKVVSPTRRPHLNLTILKFLKIKLIIIFNLGGNINRGDNSFNISLDVGKHLE
jgi:hypothetical protein